MLNEDQQSMLITVGSRAILDPWFGAFATIPMTLTLVFVPVGVKLVVSVASLREKYDNVTPRHTPWDQVLNNKAIANLVKRCIGAHENGWEAFISFVPAVLMCRMQKADGKLVRELCMQFVRIRMLYIFVYLIAQWKAVAALRTLTWLAGMRVVLKLYLTALLA